MKRAIIYQIVAGMLSFVSPTANAAGSMTERGSNGLERKVTMEEAREWYEQRKAQRQKQETQATIYFPTINGTPEPEISYFLITSQK